MCYLTVLHKRAEYESSWESNGHIFIRCELVQTDSFKYTVFDETS
jgi:hypothetical protein